MSLVACSLHWCDALPLLDQRTAEEKRFETNSLLDYNASMLRDLQSNNLYTILYKAIPSIYIHDLVRECLSPTTMLLSTITLPSQSKTPP